MKRHVRLRLIIGYQNSQSTFLCVQGLLWTKAHIDYQTPDKEIRSILVKGSAEEPHDVGTSNGSPDRL